MNFISTNKNKILGARSLSIGNAMWGALKDGFKEFATDALKEGGSLVKDTTEETERLKRAATDNLQRIGSRIGGATAGIDDETEVEHDQKEAESNYDGSLVETESKVDAAMSSSSPKSSATPSAELILERPANSNQLASGPHEASLRASSPRQRQSSLNFPRASLLMTSTLIDPPSQSMPSTLLERDDTVHELQVLLRKALDAKVAAEADAAASIQRAVDLAEQLATSRAEADELRDERNAAVRDRDAVTVHVDGDTESSVVGAASLEAELAARDALLAKMREDNEVQHRELEDLKRALREVEREVSDAREEASTAVRALRTARRDMVAAEASAAALRKQAAESDEAAESQWANRVHVAEAESRELLTQLTAARSLAEAARERASAAEAVAAERAAKTASAEAARLSAELEATEARAAAANAAAIADSARIEREEATGRSARLESDSERRAKSFNDAVNLAVSGIKDQLEHERDELGRRCVELQSEIESAHREVAKAVDRLATSEEQRRAAEAEARASTLEARTVEQVASALRTTVETERAKLRAALNAVEEANKRAERAEADVSAAQLALAAERNIAAEATASSISDRDRATALHTRLEQATSEMRDAEERARNDRKASVTAVDALEMETTSLQVKLAEAEKRASCAEEQLKTEREQRVRKMPNASTSPGRRTRPTSSGFALGALELENVSLSGTGNATVGGGGGLMPQSVGKRSRLLSSERAASLGTISFRTWLLLGYLFTLHVMVMITPRQAIECASDDERHRLPGLR